MRTNIYFHKLFNYNKNKHLNLFNAMRILPVIIAFFLISEADSLAADNPFDSKGKDFWFTFMPNVHNTKKIKIFKKMIELFN